MFAATFSVIALANLFVLCIFHVRCVQFIDEGESGCSRQLLFRGFFRSINRIATNLIKAALSNRESRHDLHPLAVFTGDYQLQIHNIYLQ